MFSSLDKRQVEMSPCQPWVKKLAKPRTSCHRHRTAAVPGEGNQTKRASVRHPEGVQAARESLTTEFPHPWLSTHLAPSGPMILFSKKALPLPPVIVKCPGSTDTGRAWVVLVGPTHSPAPGTPLFNMERAGSWLRAGVGGTILTPSRDSIPPDLLSRLASVEYRCCSG